MTLSLHKLLAGVGYEYLTRQVARLDTTRPGRGTLVAYYTARGETPGVWVGSGVAGVDGLAAGDMVTAEQMRHLFSDGLHPLADVREQQALDVGAPTSEVAKARRLGTPFRLPKGSSAFLAAVDGRVAVEIAAGFGTPAAAEVRARITSEVGAEWFQRDRGRLPGDAREMAAAVTRWSRPASQPVAGFDLTFSPVKSVSTLWAVADPNVAARIAQAHDEAVADALRFVEQRALFTREGTNGVRQVEVRGLVATAFVHRDSRAGDPDLHTHVAVANKVETLDGKWLAIDGRALYTAVVTASETYNTALEAHLRERLGLRFAERTQSTVRQGRPVREIVGVDPALNERWSSRRQAIDVRREELARRFQASAGRPPTREEGWQLAQQATLDTRDRKHSPRTLFEQRSAWRGQAELVLGGPTEVQAMVTAALHPNPSATAPAVDAAWVAAAATRVVETMEGERATWARSHVRAEALRRVRGACLSPAMVEHVTDLVVGEALNRSVALRTAEPVAEPARLRRSDGTSVYDHAYRGRFTSTRILEAEGRVMVAARRRDGRRLDPAAVDVAVARASAVDGVALNTGQASLVHTLAGSGARVQLALAPAGTGKTTALKVLADAWTDSGGTIIGLAPSAAAAAVLGEHIAGPTDTLAKLVWSLNQPGTTLPAWMSRIGPGALVVVDEAGLADTLSLDTVIDHVLDRGGSVRLVGDDRQLGAVGAGGLLRDLDARHGAARLTEVVRFADPAEAAASLALRDGRPESLGFYLDQGRVHVGDPTTTADQLFDGWTRDRAAGVDSLMLAPTNALAADLNARARAVRLGGNDPGHVTHLTDGNQASHGDVVLTRTNDRRIRSGRGSWVRNGNRWVVTAVHADGGLAVGSVGGDRSAFLPQWYVAESVQLGYASTVHSAQGVTCDTMHGLVTGAETRPHLYTLLTRGRTANHLYLQLGDGEVHDLARPGDYAPTPTEILEQILARDDTAQSAISHQAGLDDPTAQLAAACARYDDALQAAVNDIASTSAIAQVREIAEELVPGLTQQPAWPALQTSLLSTDDPARQFRLAVARGPLADGRDPAAVLNLRVADNGPTPGRPGAALLAEPLPWLARIPGRLQQHPTWGPYLTARSTHIASLADQVRTRAHHLTRPVWVQELPDGVPDSLVTEVAVWRAATDVAIGDLTPTGTYRHTGPARRWQEHFDRLLATASMPNGWAEQVTAAVPHTDGDPFLHRLAERLSRLAANGVDIEQHLVTAASEGPLPDDHPAAALWWRLQRHLPRTAEPTPAQHPATPSPPESGTAVQSATRRPTGDEVVPATNTATIDAALLVAGFIRLAQTRPPSPVDHRESRAVDQSSTNPTLRGRLLTINNWTLDFYRNQFPGSWSSTYLNKRCGVDLTDDGRFQPGHAPRGGRALTRHLHGKGVTETEMVAAGVAARTADGHLIDRFRDRLILPIRDSHQDVVGFVARRHPDRNDSDGGPRYLNTPTTTLYAKADHLYGSHLAPTWGADQAPDNAAARAEAALPVLVEGPIDAIAVTLAGGGRYLGLSPLGTALTLSQAANLADLAPRPVLATDPDPAGRAAAQRDFWLLAQHRCDPTIAALPHHLDPASVLTQHGATALRQALDQALPLGDRLIQQLGHGTSGEPARRHALRAIAARPPETWNEGVQVLSRRSGTPEQTLREELLPLAQEWTNHPEVAARTALASRPVGQQSRPVKSQKTTPQIGQVEPARVNRRETPRR